MDNEQSQINTSKTPLWQRIANVLSWVLLGITILIMAFTIFSSLTFTKESGQFEGKKVFGVSLLIVQSDSMKATDFAAGDLIFIQEVDPSTLKEGDIICFTSQDPGSLGKTVTHKIKSKTTVKKEIEDQDGNKQTVYVPAFKTYGTTTGEEDKTPVEYDLIHGKYVGKIPAMGYVFDFLKSPAGYVCIILIPFALLIGYQVFKAVKAFKAYRSEQTSEIREERNNLKKEREENQKMLEEMRALKAQLDAMKASVSNAEASEVTESLEPSDDANT